jgi:hypothetical protein
VAYRDKGDEEMSRQGWHRALDVQMDTHKWCLSNYGSEYNMIVFASLLGRPEIYERFGYGDNDDDSHIALAASMAMTLWRADTIYVTTDMLHIMLQAAHDLPDTVTFDEHTLITPNGFCLFEEALEGKDRNGKNMLVHAMAWTKEHITNPIIGEPPIDAIILYFMVDPTDETDDYNADYLDITRAKGVQIPPLVLTHMFPGVIGKPPPYIPEAGGEFVTGLCKLFLAMQLLAQQRIGQVQPTPLDRAARKRYARNWGPNAPERVISLITLRRKKGKPNQDPNPVPWSRRWVVKGHWRRQWYPSIGKHDWKYIAEFIKGPEGKPLVITERRVFNFKR